MGKALKKIPHYTGECIREQDGILRISLVDRPAVESDFKAYSEQEPVQTYRIADEEKRRVFGVVMRADYPIYRISPDLGEYYITFSAESIRQFAQKYLAESRQNRVDLDHDMWEVRGVEMVQYFLKDSAGGIAPQGFDDIADGSLFAEFQITDDAIWAAVKAGKYKGFSVEIMHAEVPQEQDNSNQDNMAVIDTIKEVIAQGVKASTKYGSVATNQGALLWEGEDDLVAGVEVWQLDEEGNRRPVADGEYITDDQKVIVVVDGKVAEIRDAEAEVAPQAEPEDVDSQAEVEAPVAEGEPQADERDARIAELEARIAELEGIVAERDARIAELEEKLKEPAAPQEQFKHTAQESKPAEMSYLDRILAAGRK